MKSGLFQSIMILIVIISFAARETRCQPEFRSGRDLPELTDSSTVEDLLVYAALNNPGLEAMYNRWLGTVERSPQAGSLPEPMLAYSQVIRNSQAPMPPQMNRLEVTQRFPWPGRLKLEAGMAESAAEAEGQRFEAARLELDYRVREACYDYYYLIRNEEVAGANLELLKSIEALVRNRYSAGAALWSDLIRSQVEAGILEDRLISLRDYRAALGARLNAELGRPPDAPLPGASLVPEEAPEPDESMLYAMLEERSPQLRALDHELERASQMIDLARKERYPGLELGIGWMMADESVGNGMKGGGRDPLMLMVGMDIPLRLGRYRAAEREAVAGRRAVELEREDRLNSLSARLQTALFEYRDAGRKVALYRDALIPKAEQSLAAAREGFSAGQNSFLELIDSQRTLLELTLALEKSLVERARSFADIRLITGSDRLTER